MLSWLIAFNVVNSHNSTVRAIWDFLYRVTEPGLRPIRAVLPNLGGIDISPVILIIASHVPRSAHHLALRLGVRLSERACSSVADRGGRAHRSPCGSRHAGGRDAIDGVERLSDGRRVLKVRVRAAASEGEANAALIGLIAKTLGVPSA